MSSIPLIDLRLRVVGLLHMQHVIKDAVLRRHIKPFTLTSIMMRQTHLRKPHGSIPGYRPGPVLSRNQRLLLWSLVVIPSLCYGMMRIRQDKREERDKLLELEGREVWEQRYGHRLRPNAVTAANNDRV